MIASNVAENPELDNFAALYSPKLTSSKIRNLHQSTIEEQKFVHCLDTTQPSLTHFLPLLQFLLSPLS